MKKPKSVLTMPDGTMKVIDTPDIRKWHSKPKYPLGSHFLSSEGRAYYVKKVGAA